MNRRTIPYGYEMKNGKLVIHKPSAGIVKEIFGRYLSGESMRNIAELFNELNIEYTPGVVGWNTARIKRILEDIRYIGDEDYPQLISDETLQKANSIRDYKNKQKNVDKNDTIYKLNAEMICPCCSNVMKRRCEPRTKIRERWICQNADCRKTIAITDDSLLAKIADILNQLTDNPDQIHQSNSAEAINLEAYRIDNEIRHMLDSRQIDKEEIRKKLIASASIHYAALDTKKYVAQRLKNILENQKPTTEFPIELFNQAVDTISFDENSEVIITLITGQIIRKEHIYAASRKKSQIHSTKKECE